MSRNILRHLYEVLHLSDEALRNMLIWIYFYVSIRAFYHQQFLWEDSAIIGNVWHRHPLIWWWTIEFEGETNDSFYRFFKLWKLTELSYVMTVQLSLSSFKNVSDTQTVILFIRLLSAFSQNCFGVSRVKCWNYDTSIVYGIDHVHDI